MRINSYQNESVWILCFFFFNDTATTEIYTLSLHDALPIWALKYFAPEDIAEAFAASRSITMPTQLRARLRQDRSEEHTSELQSRQYLVCRLLLEKKKNNKQLYPIYLSTNLHLTT